MSAITLIPPSSPDETPDQQRQRLRRIVTEGIPLMREFGERSDALVTRGFDAYAPRRSFRHWWKEWRFQHSDEAEAAPVLPPPLPLPDAALPPDDGA
jgi:hypothetical protein